VQDEINEQPGSHEPTEYHKTPKKAAASGWIGSALEYYDFFIYAQAAALVFPNIFFPKTDPQVAIVAAFAAPSAPSCWGTGATRTGARTCSSCACS